MLGQAPVRVSTVLPVLPRMVVVNVVTCELDALGLSAGAEGIGYGEPTAGYAMPSKEQAASPSVGEDW